MAALFNKTRNFSRSQSSSNISSSSSTLSRDESQSRNGPYSLPRSASYASSLHDTESFMSSTAASSTFTSRETSRESSPTRASARAEKDAERRIRSMTDELQRHSVKDARPKTDNTGKRKSFAGFMSRVRGASDKSSPAQPVQHQEIVSLPKARNSKLQSMEESRPAPNRRKSWLGSSRSPSPARTVTTDDSFRDETSTLASSVSSISVRDSSPLRPRKSQDAASIRSRSSGPTLSQKSAHQTKFNEELPPPLPPSTAPSIRSTHSRTSSGPAKSRSSLSLQPEGSAKLFYKDKLASMGLDSHKKKDDLWSVFRQLETDYQKFVTTSSALRVNVVRKTLLPFLRSHKDHAANKNIRIEDLDKRIEVLDKWWVGLLDLLDGNSNRYVSGGDRPAVFEALSGIMCRPEWRLAPSDLATYADQSLYDSQSASSFTGESATSLYRAEAVYESVKSTFIRNLLQQVGIVVEKMSLKAAPASLVNFCGKAVAYAFFFCPGVADVLVKIWAIQPDMLRRIAEEYGLPRHSRRHMPDDITEGFPLSIQSLGWTSPKTLIGKLRQPTALPIDAAQIKWHGAWTSRWIGRDSDLFFVFCKHYHILLEEFLPPDIPLIDKSRAPCFLLVQCQLLASLESTIHRQSIGEAAASALPPVTFDELLKGADAIADTLPLAPSTNVQRMMAENRMITLLRDFLAEKSPEGDAARKTFATAFKKIMHATAVRTSQFDHAACFTLCDFMEEALTIYIKFEGISSVDETYIDWKFWLDVCQKMLESQNTMTELRVLSLVYAAWNTITSDDERREYICLGWLVSRKTFQAYFLHWCPMVRAYYMRLLTWRLCRFTGEASKLETRIMAALYGELKFVWSNYIYLRNNAEERKIEAPSAAACLPAPNRRLLIIRVDTQAAAATLMLGLDNAGQKSSSSNIGSSLASTNPRLPESPSESKDSPRNRWAVRNKSSSSSSSSVTQSSAGSKAQKMDANSLEKARSDVSSIRSHPSAHTRTESSSSTEPADATTYVKYSFKFSLEWSAGPSYTHPAFLADVSSPSSALASTSRLLSSHRGSHSNLDDLQNSYGKERKLSPPRLPATAHSWLVSKVPGSSGDEIMPLKPMAGIPMRAAKYSGRALAEWLLIVTENNNFVQRRVGEGVPNLKAIEVPVLGVEGFRKFL